jgi:chromosome segregation ATPase
MKHTSPWRIAGLAAALTCGFPLTARTQDEGVKQVEQLVKKSGSTVQAIAETKLQLMKTMDVYNTLLADDATDRKAQYKKLQKEMESTEKKRAEITVRAGEMGQEAESLFKSWADSTAAIASPDLRKRSEERLAKTKASYAEIGTLGQKAADLYQPVMKSLADQVTYLGHDLNAEAIATLKPDAAKLNEKVKELAVAIDKTISVANTNIGALRPQ